MTKGPVALVLAGVFFLAGLACGREIRTRAALAAVDDRRRAHACCCRCPGSCGCITRSAGTSCISTSLAGNLYYITQPQSFSNRAFNHTLYVSTFFAGFFPWSIVALGGAIDTFRRWRARIRIPPEEILLWVVGRRRVRLLQHRPLQGRSLRLSRSARVLPARRARVDERQRLPARSSPPRATTCSRAGRLPCSAVILVVAAAVSGFSLFDLGLDLPPAALLIPISLAAGGVVLEATILRSRAVSPARVRRSARDAARDLRLRGRRSGCRFWSAHARRKPWPTVCGRSSAADDQVGAVPARKMAVQPAVLPRAAGGPAAESGRRQEIPRPARAATS